METERFGLKVSLTVGSESADQKARTRGKDYVETQPLIVVALAELKAKDKEAQTRYKSSA